jgi:ketosteroid isomerase-like protein
MEPSEVARVFVSRINAHDVDGLCSLMTDDHAFVDALDNRVVGRSTMQGGWRAYFSMVPDYWVKIDTVLQEGSTVALFGRAGGSYSADSDSPKQQWHVPAAWLAEVKDDRVAVWRVYTDNLPLRQLMGGNAGEASSTGQGERGRPTS